MHVFVFGENERVEFRKLTRAGFQLGSFSGTFFAPSRVSGLCDWLQVTLHNAPMPSDATTPHRTTLLSKLRVDMTRILRRAIGGSSRFARIAILLPF